MTGARAAFHELMHEHNVKEEQVLYPATDRLLDRERAGRAGREHPGLRGLTDADAGLGSRRVRSVGDHARRAAAAGQSALPPALRGRPAAAHRGLPRPLLPQGHDHLLGGRSLGLPLHDPRRPREGGEDAAGRQGGHPRDPRRGRPPGRGGGLRVAPLPRLGGGPRGVHAHPREEGGLLRPPRELAFAGARPPERPVLPPPGADPPHRRGDGQPGGDPLLPGVPHAGRSHGAHRGPRPFRPPRPLAAGPRRLSRARPWKRPSGS